MRSFKTERGFVLVVHPAYIGRADTRLMQESSAIAAGAEAVRGVRSGVGYDPPRARGAGCGVRRWADVVEAALRALGGRARLPEIYAAMLSRRPTDNQHWQEKIRQVLQRGPFRNTARGEWAPLEA